MKAPLNAVVIAGLVLALTRVAQTSPPDVYRKSINSVVWIVNFLSASRKVSAGSGVLVDRQRRWVVTNKHVAHNEETMDVYFPVRDRNGSVIDDREYYTRNHAVLKRLGYAAVGTVIARDSEKDLAVLELSRLPATATALELADHEPARNEGLNMIGNPGCVAILPGFRRHETGYRGVWRWARASVRKVGRFVTTLDNGQNVDFLALHTFADSFGGNSGGPILNDAGKIVGICESRIDMEGGMYCTAVHSSEVRDLLDSIREWKVFSITNRTRGPVPYQVSYGNHQWEEKTLDKGEGWIHWYTESMYPTIRFDHSYSNGYQEKRYELRYYTARYGRGCHPTLKRDAREYNFRRVEGGLELYGND